MKRIRSLAFGHAFVIVLACSQVQSAIADSARLVHERLCPFRGDLTDSLNLSGLALVHGMLAVCGDETAQFDLLKRDGDHFQVVASPSLGKGGIELDLEGMTAEGNTLYIIGSHSLARKAADPGKSYKNNLKRILQVNKDKNRQRVFRLEIDEAGEIKSRKHISLQNVLMDDPLLGRFTSLPSKENGIDIEGIAARDQTLFIGFRGPVLRGNYVPVVVLDFDDPEDYELLFVQLDGKGVRDIAAVDGGFLILAGPVGDAPADYRFYFWDGEDCLAGTDSPGGKCEPLGDIEVPDGGKAEGLAVTNETRTSYDVLVVFDGVDDGVFRFTVPKLIP